MLNSALTHALLLISIVFPAGLASRCPSANELNDNLGKRLSLGSSITNHTASAPRWSLYHAPRPAIVVNVALESDVASTVNFEMILDWQLILLY